MKKLARRLPFFLPAGPVLAAWIGGAAALPAQVPLGHVVAAGYSDPAFSGPGGIYILDPNTAAVTPVTGLPCEVVGNCLASAPIEGPDLVLALPSTGRLVTNSWGQLNNPVSAFVLDLTGSAVTGYTRYDLATVSSFAGQANAAAALLADERVLLVMDPTNCVAPGPLAGAILGILDPNLPPTSPNAVTAIPVAPIPVGVVNGLAVDLELGVAYVPTESGSLNTIYSIPIPGGGTPTVVASFSGRLNAMTLEPDGQLLIGGRMAGTGRVWRVDPSSGRVTLFPQNFGAGTWVNALSIDPVSGDLFMVLPDNSIARLSPRSATGVVSAVTNGSPAGYGRLAGLDLVAAIETYGAGSGDLPPARWGVGPNPGGAPTLGNGTFSLTNRGDSGTAALWVLGFSRMNVSIGMAPAVELLLTPDTAWVLPIVPGVGSNLNLPVPTDPALRGMEVYVQCAVTGAGSLTASSGLRVTLH